MRIELDVDDTLARYGAQVDPAIMSRAFNEAFAAIVGTPKPVAELTVEEARLLDATDLAAPADAGAVTAAARDSAALHAQLLATALTVDEVAGHLNVNPSRIRQRIGARELYALRDGHQWRLPLFQFLITDDRVVPTPNASEVFPRLAEGLAPIAVAAWFTTPNDELYPGETDSPASPLSPKAWLAQGYPAEVVARLAEHLAGAPAGERAPGSEALIDALVDGITQLESDGDRPALDVLYETLRELRERDPARQ